MVDHDHGQAGADGDDGFGLLRELRGVAATRTLPVILLSARAGEEATAEGLQAGANDYLIKPFDTAALLAKLGKFVGANRAQDACVPELTPAGAV